MTTTLRTGTTLGLIGAVSATLALVMLLMMVLSNPAGIGPFGVTLWFLSLGVALTGILTLSLYGIKAYLNLHATGAQRLRYSLRQGGLIALWVTVLMALSSLGQFTMRDGLLLALILVVAETYIRLRRP